MISKLPQHIILNGLSTTAKEIKMALEKQSGPTSSDWQAELVQFLAEWFSDADFVVAQTSGSTGEPKPIQHSKSVMMKSAERTIAYFGLRPGNRLLLSLPCR